jgi:hypothetical protein
MGDTQWLLFRGFSASDARTIMENRKSKGFSALLVMLTGFEADPMPNIEGDLPWIGDDPGMPNERYYNHADSILQIAVELELLVVLGIYHKSHNRFYTPENANRSGLWIADRYRNVPNIVWSMYPEARRRSIPTVRAFAEGLAQGDEGAHLITVHPDPSPQSSSFLAGEPWIAFNTLQSCTEMELLHPMVASDYGLTPARPSVMGEGAYEGMQFGRLISPLDIRRQAYWTFLAGGHVVYGHNEHYVAVERMQDWIDSAGSTQMATFRRIVEGLPRWWDVVPDQSIIYRGLGVEMDLAAAARSRESDWALIYFSSPRVACVRMDRIRTSDEVCASWIDPICGKRVSAGKYSYVKPMEFTTPEGWQDSLLLLEGC